MKKLLFLILIIALVVLAACSSQPTADPTVTDVEDVDEIITTTTTVTTPTVSVPTEMAGDVIKCDNLSVYEFQEKCKAIETRNIQKCADQPKIDHLEECVIEVAKFSFTKSKASDCDVLDDELLKTTCEALLKQDVDVCLEIPKGFGSSEQMRECVYLVSTKMENKKLCSTFVDESQSFVDACLQNCYTRWTGVNAENYVDSCEDRVDKGFEPLY